MIFGVSGLAILALAAGALWLTNTEQPANALAAPTAAVAAAPEPVRDQATDKISGHASGAHGNG